MRWWRSPTVEDRRPHWLTAGPYAHRGLHGPGRPENSLAAFRAAIAAGEGIELDVQACRGGRAIVFHDARLDRLCGLPRRIADLTADALSACRLEGSDETIPTLDDALALVAGRVPLLVEIKTGGLGWAPLCRSVAHSLSGYHGPAAIMSFSAPAIRWFRNNAPQLTRGLVISEEKRKSAALQHLAFRAARPDFLAYDVRSLPSDLASRARTRGMPILAWTVRDAQACETARLHADQIIHELR